MYLLINQSRLGDPIEKARAKLALSLLCPYVGVVSSSYVGYFVMRIFSFGDIQLCGKFCCGYLWLGGYCVTNCKLYFSIIGLNVQGYLVPALTI